MKRLRLSATLLLTIFVAFGATACDTITGGDDDITGTYTLQTIKGESLPVLQDEDDTCRRGASVRYKVLLAELEKCAT